MSRYLLLALCCLLVAACEAEATPFPVDLPTPPTAPPTPAVIRYALAANTTNTVADMTLLERSATITQLTEPVNPAELGTTYDLIAAYGIYPDTARSPASVTYTLLINTALPPLNEVTNSLLQSLDTVSLTAALDIPGAQPIAPETDSRPTLPSIRATLANAGWPDGFNLIVAHDPIPGAEALTVHFSRLNVILNPVPIPDTFARIHLALVTWTATDERDTWIQWAGPGAQAIDLFALPISYWAMPDLTITYSPQGWPVPARPQE